jgi:hypothetical protein
LQDPPKFTQIWIFGLKTNHLATLLKYRKKLFLVVVSRNPSKTKSAKFYKKAFFKKKEAAPT